MIRRPAGVIRVEGIAPGKASDVRSTLEARYSNEYDVTGAVGQQLHGDDEQPVELALEKKTVRRRLNIRDGWTRWV